MSKRRIHIGRGFTLIEMVICVAIIGILTAIMIPNYGAFDSTALLESEAYEIATSIREAQVYSLSARTAGGDPYAYGIRVDNDPADQNQYSFVRFPIVNGVPAFGGTPTVIQTYTMDRTIIVDDVCVVRVSSGGTSSEVCDLEGLSVAFIRPEFEAKFNVEGDGAPDGEDIESALLKLRSPRGDNVWNVRIGLFGDITVARQ